MLKQQALAGVIVGACVLAVASAGYAQQGRGGRGGAGGRPQFPTAEQFAQSPGAKKHSEAAAAIAGSDPYLQRAQQRFCSATGPLRAALERRAAGLPAVEDHLLEPTKVFDNLYYFGFTDVGAWAINTSDGIILFDGLNNEEEARDVIIGGLRKVGLDPARIKHLIVGHGHNDHTGGALHLQETYRVPVYMGGPDWELVERNTNPERPQPRRSQVVTNGQKITLGDTTITLMLTPGHTPGTLAAIVPVKHNGKPHTVLILSGSQMPTSASADSFQRLFEAGKAAHAESALGGHPDILVNTTDAMDEIRKQYPRGDAHPYLLGEETFNRWSQIMVECGRARVAALDENYPPAAR